jgi:hypothetical protein
MIKLPHTSQKLSYFLFHAAACMLLLSCEEHVPIYIQATQSGFIAPGIVRYTEESSSEIVTMKISDITCTTTGPSVLKRGVHYYHDVYGEVCGQTCRPENDGPEPFSYIVRAQSDRQLQNIKLIFQNSSFELKPSLTFQSADTNAVIREETIDGIVYPSTAVLYTDSADTASDIDSVYFIYDKGILKIFERNGKTWIRRPA